MILGYGYKMSQDYDFTFINALMSVDPRIRSEIVSFVKSRGRVVPGKFIYKLNDGNEVTIPTSMLNVPKLRKDVIAWGKIADGYVAINSSGGFERSKVKFEVDTFAMNVHQDARTKNISGVDGGRIYCYGNVYFDMNMEIKFGIILAERFVVVNIYDEVVVYVGDMRAMAKIANLEKGKMYVFDCRC